MADHIDSLALLSLKCAPNVFDLSTGLTHVSVRDQIVRAELLIRDLAASGLPFRKILVIGAGVAGVAAGLEAARLGKSVTILETNPDPFELQYKASKRYIGPFMYEWPSIFHGMQDFPPRHWPCSTSPSSMPPRSLEWRSPSPISGRQFASRMRIWLKKKLLKWPGKLAAPLILTDVQPLQAEAWVNHFVRKKSVTKDIHGTDWTFSKAKSISWMMPDFIILAAGMGPEKLTADKLIGQSFWSDDQLCVKSTSNKRIAVLGGGDGALQDVLRALTGKNHPLHAIEQLNGCPAVATLLEQEHPYLLTLENQSRSQATWTTDNGILRHIDEQCASLASKLSNHSKICLAVASLIRSGKGKVEIFVMETHFGKAYLLNRFLVHLILACQRVTPSFFAGKMCLCVHWGAEVKSASSTGPKQATIIACYKDGSKTTHDFDHWIIRFGIDTPKASGYQMIGISDKNRATRTILSQVPLPYYLNR